MELKEFRAEFKRLLNEKNLDVCFTRKYTFVFEINSQKAIRLTPIRKDSRSLITVTRDDIKKNITCIYNKFKIGE